MPAEDVLGVSVVCGNRLQLGAASVVEFQLQPDVAKILNCGRRNLIRAADYKAIHIISGLQSSDFARTRNARRKQRDATSNRGKGGGVSSGAKVVLRNCRRSGETAPNGKTPGAC